jgi:hypothetical protein
MSVNAIAPAGPSAGSPAWPTADAAAARWPARGTGGPARRFCSRSTAAQARHPSGRLIWLTTLRGGPGGWNPSRIGSRTDVGAPVAQCRWRGLLCRVRTSTVPSPRSSAAAVGSTVSQHQVHHPHSRGEGIVSPAGGPGDASADPGLVTVVAVQTGPVADEQVGRLTRGKTSGAGSVEGGHGCGGESADRVDTADCLLRLDYGSVRESPMAGWQPSVGPVR